MIVLQSLNKVGRFEKQSPSLPKVGKLGNY
jgi:hypothetical protein